MSSHVNRRQALFLGTAAASLLAPPFTTSAAHAGARAAAATSSEPFPPRLRPFPLSEVSLGPGVFADKRARMLDFARGYDENRLLLNFRVNADLPTHGVSSPEGWESLDGEANGNLRGHFTGHFMTMLAQAHAATGEDVFLRKLRTLVSGLYECRQALNRAPSLRTGPGPFGRAVEVRRGSHLHLDVPAESLHGLSELTFAAWVRPTVAEPWARILDYGDDTETTMFLTACDGDGLPRFAITRAGADSEERIVGTRPLSVGEWNHVAVTLGGGTGLLYLNGHQVGQNRAMTLTPSELGPLAHCWLGRSHYGDPVYAGGYHDVNLWSSVLSAEQIARMGRSRAAEVVGPGDRFSYPCDEHGGTVLHDVSGAGRHARYARTWGRPSHPGFLAAYPETQFILLESLTSSDYHLVWAPYYTAHKILQGLSDAYETTNDSRALELASGMCDWMYSRLSRLTEDDRQRMWSIFSSGEYGGIVEAILRTHEHTREPRHLRLARYFDLDSLIEACARDRDVLEGKHANQHIPILTGLVLLWERTGERRYHQAAHNFWRMVVPPRMFAIGGTGEGEFFHRSGAVAELLGPHTAETCCAYNMLKLTRELFLRDPCPDYTEYYERTLVNQILGSKQDTVDPERPLTTYFVGQQPGAVRDYTPKNGTTCCEGTGMESATKYQDCAYFVGEDQESLHVALYLPSTLRWHAKGVRVEQRTSFPHEGRSRIRINGSAEFELHLRVPAWVVPGGFAVRVNGVPHPVRGARSRVRIARRWSDGDVVEVDLPFALRAEPTPDDPTVQSLMYGPVHLVALEASTEFLNFGLHPTARLSGDLSRALTPLPNRPLHFRLGGVELAPFFEGTTEPCHSYFRREEPRIVFDSVDSGVPNRTGPDGTTFLDRIWSAAPFADKGELVERVTEVSGLWCRQGVFTVEERRRIRRAVARARYEH
ncbi:beta-L-arabinofuranosidase domain-containing protein [Actinopolyspora mortivallis]|uniref:beta-L-arabinofuranosidase domain-containing protein n=1 Tax=Actinopolyspora mortivallis TaxID=33906 RepID=UPI00052555A5|nr:beta-L-arabinofuranosidase domain-containing protein [Actinopolyspora mortivallis]